MNCQDFENLLPDALGGELSESEQAAFEGHLAACATCRSEHKSLTGAVGRMRSLPEPAALSVRRVGDGLLLTPSTSASISALRWTRSSRGFLRYAAVILLAFVAGYSTSSVNSVTPNVTHSPVAVSPGGNPANNLQTAVAMQFSRNPARSDLAKGLLAMYDSR